MICCPNLASHLNVLWPLAGSGTDSEQSCRSWERLVAVAGAALTISRNRVIVAPAMLNSVLWWLHDHALPMEVLLVVASGLLALYADTVRHFVSLPPQRLSTWFLKARLLSVNSKLFNLCECHNNAFATVVYVARAFVFVLVLIGLFLGGIFLELVSVRSANRAVSDLGLDTAYSRFHANLDISLALVFVVVVCCRLLLLGEFLYRLRNFKGYDHYLMEHVAELEDRLVVAENSDPTSVAE